MRALRPGPLAATVMSALKNDTFLRALLRQPTDYTPLWLMRQAGRYLPEYNATRARAGDFLTLCKTPDLATEVTLQPLARYPLDAAILFSDILTVPDAMGLGLYFAQGEGPRFERPLRDEWEIRDLSAPDPTDRLGYVMDAVRSIRRALDGSVPLIGFSGSPYTLACYMIEGGSSDDYRHLKTMLYSRPDLLHRVKPVREPLQALNRPMTFDAFQQAAVDGVALHSDVPVGVQKRIVALGISLFVHRQHAPEERVERRRGGKKHAAADVLARQGYTRETLYVDLGSDAPEKIQSADRKTGSIHRVPALVSAGHDGCGQNAGQQGQRIGWVDDEQRRPHHRRHRQRPEDLRTVNRQTVQKHMGGKGEEDEPKPTGPVKHGLGMGFQDPVNY